MATRIRLRRGTALDWTTENPTLTSGEAGFETDTGFLKIGNGTDAWADLGYIASDLVWGNITGTLTNQTDLDTALGLKANSSGLATVATSGAYADLTGQPSIPVDSVNALTGAVVLDPDDLDDSATTNKFVTASDITNLGNLSGTNTGDQDLSSYLTSATASSTYEPIKGVDDNFVTDAEKTTIGNLSGTNTGDQDLSGLFNKSTDDTDDITEGVAKFTTAGDISKLAGIASGADVSPTTKRSLALDSGQIQLVNDETTPTSSKYYGTNGAGTRGFHALPTADVHVAPISKVIGNLYGRPVGTGTTVTGINSGVCAWLVWTAPWACSIDAVYFEVTTAGAGGSVGKVSRYAVGTGNIPTGSAIETPSTVAVDSTGIKSVTLAAPVALTKGQQVAFCLQASATSTYRSFTNAHMGGIPTTNLTSNSSIRQTATYAGGPPTANAVGDTANNNIMILPRVSA